MKGFAAAALALIALQVVLSTPLARVSTAAILPARWADEWMSPAVPLIPSRTGPDLPEGRPGEAPPASPVPSPRVPPPPRSAEHLNM